MSIPEYFFQNFLRSPVCHAVEDHHKLLEVDIPIVVGVIYPKHVLLHLPCIFLWQSLSKVNIKFFATFQLTNLRHHFTEVFWFHLPIWMFCHPGIKGSLDLRPVLPTRAHQAGDVLLSQHRLPVLRSHPDSRCLNTEIPNLVDEPGLPVM